MSTIDREPEARTTRFHVPSLQQIFWGPLANGFRRMAQWRKQGVLGEALQDYRRRSIRFEALEPRLLLSADLTHTAEVGAAIDATLRVDEVDGAAILRLVDNQSSTVIDERLLDQDVDVSVTGGDLNDRLVIDFDQAALAHQVHVSFIGGASNDTVIFAGGSLAGTVDGGEGEDTLVGPAGNQIWTIDGENSGNAAGMSFSGIENLEGAADNEDTFVFTATGALSGLLKGGDRGFDSIELVGGDFPDVVYNFTGIDSGSIEREPGNVITYSGFEPITSVPAGPLPIPPAAGPASVTLNYNVGGAQTLTISGAGDAITVTSTAAESVTFSRPTTTLIINASANQDTIVVQGLGNFNGTLEINALGGDDAVEIQAVTAAATYDIDGGTHSTGDTVTATASGAQDAALSDDELTIGSETITISGIEVAELFGGAGSNTFTVSGWSGTANLNGQAGDDIYKLGSGGGATDNFGIVNVTDDANEGDADRLDFTGHNNPLTVTGAGANFTSNDGSSVLHQVGAELAEEIDDNLPSVDLATGTIAKIETFLDNLLTYVQKLQDGAEGFGELFNQLPLIDGEADGAIAELTGLTAAITEFVNDAKAALDPNVDLTLQAVVAKLDGLLSLTPPFSALSLDVGTSYRGSDPDAPDAPNSLELLLDFSLHAAINNQSFTIDFGEQGALLGVALDADIEVDAVLEANFSVGISTASPLEVFLVPGGTIALTLDALADVSGTSFHVGFLDLTVGPMSTIALDGRVTLTFTDDALEDGRISLADVVSGTTDVADVTEVNVTDPDGDPYLDVDITLSVASGVLTGGVDLSTATVSLGLALSEANPFADGGGATGIEITSLNATLPGPVSIDLLDFGNVSPTDVMGMLGGVLDTLVALAGSEFMQVVIPYSGKTLGEILDYGQSFKEELLDPLFKSGNFLAPDFNGDGTISMPSDSLDPEMRIDSIQDLVGKFKEYLGLPSAFAADFDGGELTFSVNFFRAFGLGGGDVTTVTPGVMGSVSEVQRVDFPVARIVISTPEGGPIDGSVQILRIENAVGGKYTITGDVGPSAAINHNAPAEGANSVKAAVMTAYGLVSDDVSVVLSSATSTARTYTVTFDVDPGPLMTANPNAVGSNKLRGSVEAFRLAFRDGGGLLQVTDVIPVQDASGPLSAGAIEDNIEDALEALSAIGTGNVGVAGSGGSFTLTFDDSLGNVPQLGFAGELDLAFGASLGDFLGFETDGTFGMAGILDTGLTFGIDLNPNTVVKIVPPVFSIDPSATILDDGVLSGPASFDVALYNLPAIGIETQTEGDDSPATPEIQKFTLFNATDGTFKLSFEGVETADIAFNAPATGAGSVLEKLEALSNIDPGDVVSVEKSGNSYTVTFASALGNVERLNANAKGLVNANALTVAPMTVNVAVDVTNTSFADLGKDVQQAIDLALFNADLTIGFNPSATAPGWHSTGLIGNGALYTAPDTPFGGALVPPSDLPFAIVLNPSTTLTGTLRAAKVQALGFAAALDAALDNRLSGTGISVAVGTDADKLTITPTGGSLEVRFKSAMQASAGGGRISLDAPLAKLSFSELEPAVEVQRRLEITVDYSNPAFQEMAIASVPTRFDGKIFDDINLTLDVNGTDVTVTLDSAVASGNSTLDQLVGQLQQAVHVGLVAEGLAVAGDPLANDIVQVKRATVDPDDPNSPKGNRLIFEGKANVVTQLSIFVPEDSDPVTVGIQANGAITELGFDQGQGDTKRSKAGSFFLEDVSFGGNLGLYQNGVSASANLGLLGITAAAYGEVAPAPVLQSGTAQPGSSATTIKLANSASAVNDFYNGRLVKITGGTGSGQEAVIKDYDGATRVATILGAWETAPNDTSTYQVVDASKFFGADVNFALKNPVDGGNRVTVDGIIEAINDGKFLFDIDDIGGDDENPGTGFVQGSIGGGLDISLALAPDGAIAGLPLGLGGIGVSAQSSNWLTTPPTPSVTFTKPTGFDALFDSLKELSFDDIITVLQLVVDMLQSLDGSDDGSPLAGVLGFKIPVIDRSISDLVDLSGDFIDFVDDLIANPAGSLQSLETRLRSLLGFPALPTIEFPEILSFDMTAKTLYFDLGFSSSASTTRPFNLDLEELGLGIFSQLVGLSASGNLGVQADVDMALRLGLDLEGADKSFFVDVDETGLTASARAFGENLSFEASLGPVGVFVVGGSASLDGSFTVDLQDAGASDSDGRLILLGFDGNNLSSDLGSLFDFLEMDLDGTAEVVLPLFYGLESSPAPMGDEDDLRDFGASSHFHDPAPVGGDDDKRLAGNELGLFVDLVEVFEGGDGFEIRMPDFDLGDLSLPSLFTLLADPSIIVKGLNTVLKEIQGILEGELFGFELPLIGDLLADNPVATFIEDFRLDFLQPLADEITESNLGLEGLIGLVEDVIDDVFGGFAFFGGLDHKFLDADGNEAPILEAKALQFDFDIGDHIEQILADINLNLPIPLLSLEGQMTPTIVVDWNLHFGFGIDLDKGFYFVSRFDKEADDPDAEGHGEFDPELTFDLELNLGSTNVTQAEIEASLAILKVTLTDGVDLDESGVVNDDEFTRLFIGASLDIRDTRGGGASGNEPDGKLTISELITQSPTDTFVFEIAGGATLLAHGELGLGGLDDESGLSLGSVLPSITADFIVNFDIGYSTLTGLDINPPELVLANISLDLGDFIGGFAGDLLNTIGDILDPLAWLIGPDGLLNFRLPLISDLVGETVRIRDLINIFDSENGPKVNAFLDFVEVLYFLTDLVDDVSGAGVLNFGDFVLFRNDDDSFFDDFEGFLDNEFSLGGLDAFGGDLRDAPNLNNLTLPDPGDADFSSQPSTAKSFTAGVTKPGSIDFPILKPETIFGLLLGKPATLFTVELPELGFEFMYRQVIPIIGPLAATFAGKISGNLDLGFGYDTLGLTQFIATENPAYLLNGFFLNDVDPATGVDRPEAIFSAEIAVGAALSLGIATVGVEGGIGADIFFNLNDPDGDTKVRFAELASNILANDGNPLAMFDISGVIEFFLRAYIEVLFFEASFEFARIKLFEFDIPFERPGVLASQQGSTLTLNIGPNAAGRMQGNTSDIGETINVKTVGGGAVVVWSSQFNVEEAIATTNPFTGVSKIIVNGGAGVDVIDLSGVQAGDGVTAVIRGGDGNDIITGGGGADEIFGDDGDDIIHAGAGADVVRGGRGDDQVFGELGADELFGEDGNDKLYGHGGGDADDNAADEYSGGRGDDEFNRSGGNDTVLLADAGSVETILGGAGTPTLTLADKNVPVTVFVKDDRILVGFGKQTMTTQLILGTSFTFTNFATLDAQFGDAFEHVIGVTDASDVNKIIGTSEADTFHVQETTSHLVLDGGSEADTFNFYADPSGANPIDVQVNDVGEKLKDENVIRIVGSGAGDKITVTDGDITLDDDGTPTQVVSYVPPSADPLQFNDQLIIKVFGNEGADEIAVESTFITVPVQVYAGAGNDTVTVGDGSLDDLKSFLNGNANDGFGFGPLVVVGGEGHDSVILDDSADTSDNVGGSSAFLEKREGVTGLVEVGVVGGLDMQMTVPVAPEDGGGVKVVDGHVEVEGVEVLEVRLGTGDDTFAIGGELIVDLEDADAGTWTEISKTDAEVPPTRLFNPETQFGIQSNVYSISGMTVVRGGDGKDDIRVLRTQALPSQHGAQAEVSAIVSATQTQPGNRVTLAQEKVRIDVRADVGYFVLEFADQNLDDTHPSGDDTVPGAEQTVVLPYNMLLVDPTIPDQATADDLLADMIKEALGKLRLVGGTGFIDDVSVNPDPWAAGVVRSFIVKFSPQLDNLPNLRALDTKLLVAGEGNDDEISVQSIDQPTYVLGGAVGDTEQPGTQDDQDTLNVNVQIGINGPELASAPDGLDQIPPAKAIANGVNAQLTVDGGVEGDQYFVYLFGGEVDSQINLFDSGGTTDDASFVFGTEQRDMFLLRAAVANDGLAFVALIKPAVVPVVDEPTTHVERVNYRGTLDSMKIYALEGDDAFAIDDTRLDMEVYGGEGEDFFQVGQLFKSQRNAAAGVPNADVFATIETTRGYLSNGITKSMKIFGGEDNDEFVVYHNLAPLALYGNDGDDSFLIRAFALVGSQEDLRERTDVSGDAGADLIQYAVNAPVFIDGGDGFDTVIVIGTEFNDDFVVTEDGVFGAGLNITFVRVETVEVDGDAGDDRFFILGTSAGILTKITGSLGSDTFFANGPTPDVVSNDLLGHSGLISHSVDSPDPLFSGIKVVGVAANVADDDEPAVRITISGGTSVVSQVDPFATDHFTVVLTRKPENGAKIRVTSRAPAGVKFTNASDGTLGDGGNTVSFDFDDTNWNDPQTGVFTAFQEGSAEIQVGNGGGNGENARQTLAIQGTEGSFKLQNADLDLNGAWTTDLISFDIRGDGKTTDGDDAGTLNREQELELLRADIEAKINAKLGASGITADVDRVRTTFFIEFEGTEAGNPIDALALDSAAFTFNDIVGTGEGFITHDVSIVSENPADTSEAIKNLFVQGKVADQRDGMVQVVVDQEGGVSDNEIQLLHFDASDGNFKIRLGDQVSEEMLFIPLDPGKVRDYIDNAINAFAGISATVTKIGAESDYSYQVEFSGESQNTNVETLVVEESNLSRGERTLKILGGLPTFVIAQGDDALRGATVKVVAGAGIGQTRLVIANTANTLTVANPWIEGLDETSRIEILRYEGVVLPATMVKIVGDDGNAIDLRESGGTTVAFEAPEVHGFVDADANLYDDSNSLAFVDTVSVSLTSKPSDDVTVALGATDAFANNQLFFAVKEGVQFKKVTSLTFDDNDAAANAWNKAQTVYVFGTDDSLTEGFHKQVLTLTANGGGYTDVVNSRVIDIADNEVALAMVLESGKSTDVVETGNVFNGGNAPTNDVDGDNAASDSYQIVLSRAPDLELGETVAVNVSADPTRTQRGAGLLGIRAFDPEVNVNGSTAATLQFDVSDWFNPQTVTVTAAADDKVDGDDSKSFPKMFDQANSIEGPLVITGGISEDRSADLEREPVFLPGETNFKPSIGTVQPVPAGVDGSFSLTINLNEVIPGETILDTRVEGGTAGVLAVATNTNGDPVEGAHEVQMLTIDAVSGTFKVSLDGIAFSNPISYDPDSLTFPDDVADDIEAELTLLGEGVTVEAAGAAAFIITFADTDNHDPIKFGSNNLVRVGTDVDDTVDEEQILTVHGNGGTFKLSVGTEETDAIAFAPDDPDVNQAQVIEAALNSLDLETVLGAGSSITVSGAGSTYIVTFVDATNAIPTLVVSEESLRVDEVQTLTLNASMGSFKLTLDGSPENTTVALSAATMTAGDLQTALADLDDVTGVTVRKDADSPFYTIIFTGPGGENVHQLEVVDSSLERTVKQALETNLDTVITSPEDLKGFTTEITRGDAKNKFRVLIGGSDPDASPAAGLTVLDISRPWEAGLTDQVPSLAGGSEFTIEKTNPNLLVDENEETDFFFLNDTDNVTSINELPTAELVVTGERLSGLGMGEEQLIGGRLLVPGGIQYSGLEELIINLGSGDNRVVIAGTHRGATTINAGAGDDTFFVEHLSGHTFLNASSGADVINVATALQDLDIASKEHLEEVLGVDVIASKQKLEDINALLTVTGDVPQAIALTLGKGSKPDPVANVGGVDEIQQITVDATGGTFQAGFVIDGVRYFTASLAYNVSAAGLQAALQTVVQAAFGFTNNNATPDVLVTRGGNVYRVTFTDQMGEQDVPLLDINDLGLTMETGAAGGDVLNVDNSADTADTQAVLTQTSLTGLGMGDLGDPGTAFNEIQTLRLDATGGTFTLGIQGTDIESTALPFDISASALDAVLEGMYLAYLNEVRLAADPDAELFVPANVSGGLVEVTRNDDVYVIRFVGLLSNYNVAQLTVDGSSLTRLDELPGGGVDTVQGLAETATRLHGITAQNQNEIQRLTITATAGTFTLAFPNTDAENVTAALPYNVTRALLQLALEALPEIVPGDVLLTEVSAGVFDIEFQGELSSTDVAQLIVNPAGLTGTASVLTTQTGRDTGLNDMQVLTVNATAGSFRLELYLPAVQRTLVTESLAFDASAEQVRRALQHELARELNGLNDDADLSRTREAFKSDFSVARVGNTYLIGFQGVTRQIDGGEGVSRLKVIGDVAFNASGTTEVVTRMDGINYYGIEQLNIDFGSGDDVLNVQGTSAGSFKGINAPLDSVHAATNITLAGGDDRIFISSNADLDAHTDKTTAGQPDVFEFLTGTLDRISGNLNIDAGEGRHRLLVSDEAATAGDGTTLDPVTISDGITTPTGTGTFDTTSAAEIQIKNLAFGDITYGADATDGDFYDGIIYWSGAGADTIDIDGTHYRAGERTTTVLNTGLGDDHVTVDLDTGEDDFFVLHTMGGAAAHSPVNPAIPGGDDDDTVRAAESTLPLIIFGGLGNDDIIAGQNEDVVFGDLGRVQYLNGLGQLIAVFGFGGRDDMISSEIIDPTWVISRDLNLGGVDILEGSEDDDILIGGAGGNSIGDYIDGDEGDDLIFGDAVELMRRDTNVAALGDISNPRFQALLGQVIYSRSDVAASAQGIATLPQGDATGEALVSGTPQDTAQDFRNQDDDGITRIPAAWTEYEIIELFHSQAIEDGDVPGLATSFGDDYIAGGTEHDVIFGQLGDDVVQGDGSIEGAVGAEAVTVNRITNPQAVSGAVYAQRMPNGTLVLAPDVVAPNFELHLNPSFETLNDGDDYIEGNGGSDVIFGGLGQDDIVGDNSSLFTLDTSDERQPHGSDIIFGGAGTNIARNDLGDATANADNLITVAPTGHSRDADVIVGDNANIYRLVGINGTEGSGDSDGDGFLEFNYDKTSDFENRGTVRVIPRAVELLDYTPGGPDFSDAADNDIGAADEIHGEGGDDFIYGMVGDDVLFGDGQDDDLIGGYGNDWISGGTGQDGVIGDDGRIFTSRNGTAEPLNGVMTATIEEDIDTPGNIQLATTHVTGDLKKAVDLTPFSQQPDWMAMADEWNGESKHTSDDVIYGGLGSDFLHGGSGDDAISGAEALLPFFAAPFNPGDVLRYGFAKAGEFAAYDEFEPLRKLLLNAADFVDPDTGQLARGALWKPGDPAGPTEFFLNFAEGEGVRRPAVQVQGQGNSTFMTEEVRDDGDDKIFGDLGNDWLVGGTGRDNLWGGWGDDLMNADDNHDSTDVPGTTDATANNVPDTHPRYEDRAYGGAGRDILIGNTGGDRLIDWAGEFNSYLVPFAPFGEGTVTRMLQPQLPEFLYALSRSDGADPSRATDEGGSADPLRNGEPFGELGLVKQQDTAWQSQTGAPNDPQPGNIPGGGRDVLRSANFNGAQPSGFFTDSGTFKVQSGALQVSAESLGGDAVSVYHVGDALPGYFEVQASVLAVKPTAGWNANSYIIFDYQGKDDFKFAGIDVFTNKLVMGHRDASGWHVDRQAAVPGGVKADKYYNVLLAVNGVNAILVVDNKNVFTHTFQPRIVDGYSYGLNWGMVGVGSDNSRGSFDNIAVQILPPQLTLDRTEDFVGQPVLSFSGYQSGTWSVDGGDYTSDGTTGMSLLDLGPDNLAVSSYLELSAEVSATGRAGFVFDRYADGSFKFVAIDAPADQVIIGHYTAKSGWVSDAVVSKVIDAGTQYTLGASLKGTTVSVTLEGQTVLGFAFNAATVDGGFGLVATGGQASFDEVRVKTNDPAFASGGGGASLLSTAPAGAASGSTLTQSELDGIATVAISQWIDALGSGDARLAALGDVRFAIADLEGSELGHAAGNTILVDADAAGNGWFVDVSPASSSEFRVRLDRDVFAAATGSDAFGHMDLFSVVGHEIGHLLGLEHEDAGDFAVMGSGLDLGVRDLFSAGTGGPAAQAYSDPRGLYANGVPGFDGGPGLGGASASVNWQDASSDGWNVKLSPYAADKPAKSASPNVVGFLVKLLNKGQADAQSPGFDSLGRALLGKDKGR